MLLTPEAKSEHHTHLAALVDGLRMTESILMGSMALHGVERIESEVGAKVDPRVQEVTVTVPLPEQEEGIVIAVESQGYTLNGRLLRPAKVVVSKKA